MGLLSIFFAGLLFSSGLVIAGMTQPSKVVGFLDVFGDWDPSLALVMLGAIGVHALSYRWVAHRKSPILAGSFQIPTKRDVDWKLLLGAALFGAGWGLAGYCPGPALSSAVVLEPTTLVFVVSMLASMVVFSLVTGRVSGRANRDPADHELGRSRIVDMGGGADRGSEA